MPVSLGKLDTVRKILGAVKRSEMARLKARLLEASSKRAAASELRRESASQGGTLAVADMLFQSRHQLGLERSARALESLAETAEQEALGLRSTLAITLGREEAARLLARDAERTQRRLAERRAETVPMPGRTYPSSPAGGSSAGTA